MRVCTHPAISARSQRGDVRSQAPCLSEQLLRPIAAHPFLEQAQVFGIVAHFVDRNLVGTPKSFDLLTVDLLGTGPAFWASQNDERPTRRLRFIAFAATF